MDLMILTAGMIKLFGSVTVKPLSIKPLCITVLPQYLIKLIPHDSHYYNTQLAGTTTTYHFKTNFSSIFFSFNNL